LQRELDGLPALIEGAEAKRDALRTLTQATDFYSQDSDLVQAKLAELTAAEAALSLLEERWLELEEMSS
jgi:ATP-binding cassette subfamily F protein uup